MSSSRRPRRGSMAFYPRKKAKRIYPRIKTWVASGKETKPLGFTGYKVGMTHIMKIDTNANSRTKGQEVQRPVTIFDCPPVSIFGLTAYHVPYFRSKTFTTIFSENIDKNLRRKLKLPKQPKADFKKIDENLSSISSFRILCSTNPGFKKTPEVFELALSGVPAKQFECAKSLLGKQIKISDIFKEGDYIDVVAVTKGKGFQGPVKRFGIKLQRRKNEQAHRHVGALGIHEPGKIRPTVPQAGQHGFQSRLELNKRILKITTEKEVEQKGGFLNYGKIKGDAVLIEGSVPGSAKRLVRFRFPTRFYKTAYPVDIKYISTTSKQGA